jgi:threonine/homoserine/homoserine lactone efflux protein
MNLSMAPRVNKIFHGVKYLKPDLMARISLFMGIAAMLFMMFPSYTLLLEIPPGILAIRFSKKAIKNGTGKKLTAVSGKVLGFIVLTSLAAEILLAIILLIIRSVLG